MNPWGLFPRQKYNSVKKKKKEFQWDKNLRLGMFAQNSVYSPKTSSGLTQLWAALPSSFSSNTSSYSRSLQPLIVGFSVLNIVFIQTQSTMRGYHFVGPLICNLEPCSFLHLPNLAFIFLCTAPVECVNTFSHSIQCVQTFDWYCMLGQFKCFDKYI